MEDADDMGRENSLKKAEYALEKFPLQYNCAQSVLRAFAGDFGVKEEDCVKYATGFGSGIATGQTCGACTGAVMAIGLYTADIEDRIKRKNKTYELVRDFLKRFQNKHGSTDCAALLGYNLINPDVVKNIPEDKQPKVACIPFVKNAVLILSDVLEEDKKNSQK
ncbi:MAG: C_GCAxxG_C_C family protein [Methanomicrobiaceae archaeon]|nr:C_GCAxxG_C_C family protein [Methanomicrobiaceae archaeon]